MSSLVQLQEISDDDIVIADFTADDGMDAPFNPDFPYSHLQDNGSISLDIGSICSKAVTDPASIEHLSLVVGGWRVEQSTVVPIMYENGGGRFSHGRWKGQCMLVGDKDGGPAWGERVRYLAREGHENTLHAMIAIAPGMMFAVGQRDGALGRTVAIYRITGFVRPPRRIYEEIDEFIKLSREQHRNNSGGNRGNRDPRQLKASTQDPMAVNAELVCLRVWDDSDDPHQQPRGYNRESTDPENPIPHTSLLLKKTLMKLGGPSTEATFIDPFFAVSPTDDELHQFTPPAGTSVSTIEVPAADFITRLVVELRSWRGILLDAGDRKAKPPIPFLTRMLFSGDDRENIHLQAYICRTLTDVSSGMVPVCISTVLNADTGIPEDLVNTDLIENHADFGELRDALNDALFGDPDHPRRFWDKYIMSHF